MLFDESTSKSQARDCVRSLSHSLSLTLTVSCLQIAGTMLYSSSRVT